jgi:hypothetical protein
MVSSIGSESLAHHLSRSTGEVMSKAAGEGLLPQIVDRGPLWMATPYPA